MDPNQNNEEEYPDISDYAAAVTTWVAEKTNALKQSRDSVLVAIKSGSAGAVRNMIGMESDHSTPKSWANMSDEELAEYSSRMKNLSKTKPVLGEAFEYREKRKARKMRKLEEQKPNIEPPEGPTL